MAPPISLSLSLSLVGMTRLIECSIDHWLVSIRFLHEDHKCECENPDHEERKWASKQASERWGAISADMARMPRWQWPKGQRHVAALLFFSLVLTWWECHVGDETVRHMAAYSSSVCWHGTKCHVGGDTWQGTLPRRAETTSTQRHRQREESEGAIASLSLSLSLWLFPRVHTLF